MLRTQDRRITLAEHLLGNTTFGLKHHFRALLGVPAIPFILGLLKLLLTLLSVALSLLPTLWVATPPVLIQASHPHQLVAHHLYLLPLPDSLRLILPCRLFLPTHRAFFFLSPRGYSLSLLSGPRVDFQPRSPRRPNLHSLLRVSAGLPLPPPSQPPRAREEPPTLLAQQGGNAALRRGRDTGGFPLLHSRSPAPLSVPGASRAGVALGQEAGRSGGGGSRGAARRRGALTHGGAGAAL